MPCSVRMVIILSWHFRRKVLLTFNAPLQLGVYCSAFMARLGGQGTNCLNKREHNHIISRVNEVCRQPRINARSSALGTWTPTIYWCHLRRVPCLQLYHSEFDHREGPSSFFFFCGELVELFRGTVPLMTQDPELNLQSIQISTFVQVTPGHPAQPSYPHPISFTAPHHLTPPTTPQRVWSRPCITYWYSNSPTPPVTLKRR